MKDEARYQKIRGIVSTLSEIAYERKDMTAAGYALKALRLADDAETDDDLETAEKFIECAKQSLLANVA